MRPISERTADPYADMKVTNSRPARQADADRRSDRRQDNGERINNRNTDRNADRSRNTDRNSDRRTNNRDNNNRDNSRDNNRDNNRGFRNDSRRPAEGGRSFDRIMTEAEAMTEAGAMTEITIEQAAEVMTEIVSEKKQLQLQLLMM